MTSQQLYFNVENISEQQTSFSRGLRWVFFFYKSDEVMWKIFWHIFFFKNRVKSLKKYLINYIKAQRSICIIK